MDKLSEWEKKIIQTWKGVRRQKVPRGVAKGASETTSAYLGIIPHAGITFSSFLWEPIPSLSLCLSGKPNTG